MPVIKSAIKKLRRDRKREKENDIFKKALDRAIRTAKKTKTAKTVSDAASIVDRAVKKKVIHKNRAARIKSALSKLSKPQTKTRPEAPGPSSASKKTAKKALPRKSTKVKK